MAMGTRKQVQIPLFLTADDLPEAPTTPFFEKLSEVLGQAGFDDFVESVCSRFYDQALGRPSLPPGVYFRMLLLGYLMGFESERRIALQAADSLSLRQFLGYGLHEATPDHSTLSKTRKRLALEAHEEVFGWVLGRLREAGLTQGGEVAVDATTLEANAALKGLVRKATGGVPGVRAGAGGGGRREHRERGGSVSTASGRGKACRTRSGRARSTRMHGWRR